MFFDVHAFCILLMTFCLKTLHCLIFWQKSRFVYLQHLANVLSDSVLYRQTYVFDLDISRLQASEINGTD